MTLRDDHGDLPEHARRLAGRLDRLGVPFSRSRVGHAQHTKFAERSRHPARLLAGAFEPIGLRRQWPEEARAVKTSQISVQTGSRGGVFDLTPACERFVAGERDGLLVVFVPHATAGLVVMELGAGSEEDLLATIERLLPRDDRWRHRHGSLGHGADHVLPLLAPPSLTVPVVAGRLQLGAWQSIALLDTNVDQGRRTVHLTFWEAEGTLRESLARGGESLLETRLRRVPGHGCDGGLDQLSRELEAALGGSPSSSSGSSACGAAPSLVWTDGPAPAAPAHRPCGCAGPLS